jgi:hypothetical protein
MHIYRYPGHSQQVDKHYWYDNQLFH